MKNNKGFTLIELIVVIGIVGIVAIAAVSGYTTMANNSRKKAYDSKVQEIEDAAVKFAKETNLQNGITISVNSLVVQGFLQPDVATDSGLAQVTNPKNQDNMICNLVTITIEDDIYVAKYDPDKKDCKVAEQELDNTEIIVTEHVLIDNKIGDIIPFEGNVANWTKEDVVLIVSSTVYTDFVSVSYDYDGQTITKPKNTPLEGNEYNDADYNKLAIKDIQIMFNSEVTITYNMSDGSTHSKTVIVRIDREVPTMRSTVTNDVTLGSTKKVSLYLDDANGSGVAGFYVSKDQSFPVGTPFIHDESNKDSIDEGAGSFAGYNSHFYGDQSTYYVKVVDKVGNEYVSEPLVVANFETATKTCKIEAVGQDGTSFGPSTIWFNKKLTITGITDQPVGTMGVKYFLGTLSSPPDEEAQLNKFFDGQTNGGILIDHIDLNTESNLNKYYMAMQGLEKDKNINYCERQVGIDLQVPTVSISCVDNDCNTYKQTHKMKITITDDRSGFYSDANSIKIGWSASNTVPPTNWETLTGGVISDYKNASNKTIKDGQMVFTTSLNEDASGDKVSGDYYLWVLGSSVKDKAQNSPADKQSDIIKYDNTPPTCTNSGGGTSWVNSAVTIVGNCSDTGSGCKKGTNGTNYTYDDNGNVSKVYTGNKNLTKQSPGTVYDKVGNSTICDSDRTVKIDVTPPTIASLKYNYRNSVYKDGNGDWNCQLVPSSCKFSWDKEKKYYYETNHAACIKEIKKNLKGTCKRDFNSKTLEKTSSLNVINDLYSSNNDGAQIYIDSVSASDTGGSELKSTTVYIADYKIGKTSSEQPDPSTIYNLKTQTYANGDHPGYVFKIVAKDNAGNSTSWKVFAVVYGGIDAHVNAAGCSGSLCGFNKYIIKNKERKWATGWVDRHYIRTYIVNNDINTVDSFDFKTYYSDGTHKIKNKDDADMCPGKGCQLHGWYSINKKWYWFNTNEIPTAVLPNGGMMTDMKDFKDWQVCKDSLDVLLDQECNSTRITLKCASNGVCDR